jgi:Tol biopolymer transport system component
VSPDGRRVAFVLHPGPDDAGSVVLVDVEGRARTLSDGWISAQGLAWHPDGHEVWFTATREGNSTALHAADLSGRERLVARVPGRLILHDVGRDGRVLFGREIFRCILMGYSPAEGRERNLSWFDVSMPSDISPDGTHVLFGEAGEAAGSEYALYLRKMDGSPAVRLGAEGALGGRFSPDGRWAAVVRVAPTAPLLLLPTGIGEARTLARHGLERLLTPAFFPDGSSVVYSAAAPGEARRLYVQSLAGDAPRAVTPPGVNPIPDLVNPVSPDGDWVTAIEADGTLALYPVNGGAPRPLRRLEPADRLARWAVFGRVAYVFRYGELPPGSTSST